jgi:hypothetical protein
MEKGRWKRVTRDGLSVGVLTNGALLVRRPTRSRKVQKLNSSREKT